MQADVTGDAHRNWTNYINENERPLLLQVRVLTIQIRRVWPGSPPAANHNFGWLGGSSALWVVRLPCVRPGNSARRPVAAVESLELLGDKPATVFVAGNRVPLTLRRAEILALLDSRSQGWSAEELAYELQGDAGTVHAIRTQMFRVRSMLGDAVGSNPYRLAAGLAGCSDSGRVLRLLREGWVAETLEAYTAPLLSRSGVLAV
ncbi:hypothetical protein QFZ35_003871 [Arthrobacter ulcerisalmonis]|nr:hypothetical protein [Arthrobacter ulcerisalmonis]